MDLYARVNILEGRSVRLPKGRPEDAIVLDNDPVARAKSWASQGVDRLHIVDLDAAAYGDYRNRDLIGRIIEEADLPVQVAGGIRSEGEVERVIGMGAWRIVMGTAAIENQIMVWEMCREYPEQIVVSLDVRPDEEVATRGWTHNSGRFLEEVLIEMSSAGAVAFLVAEANRDALIEPPNLQILAEALAIVDEPVIAAGGVRDLEDLRQLAQLESNGRRLGGVVVGREVTVGRFSIPEAKEVLAGGGPLRAPGGVSASRTRLGVASLDASLEFYGSVLGFDKVRTGTNDGAVVVQASAGQQFELVEGPSGRPECLTFKVSDLQRWREHLANLGVETTASAGALEVADPDGVTIRFEG
jgi:phosphoribosylformimino-5-aminoimidazole carboxamide ribotide isomerase